MPTLTLQERNVKTAELSTVLLYLSRLNGFYLTENDCRLCNLQFMWDNSQPLQVNSFIYQDINTEVRDLLIARLTTEKERLEMELTV